MDGIGRALNLFIDDGGVMNDNAVRAPQWQALVGEFFAPRLSGEPKEWAAANRIATAKLWEQFPYIMGRQPDGDFDSELRKYELAWFRVMCQHVGVPHPDDEDQCLAIGLEAVRYILPRVRSAYSGAVDALRTLAASGFRMYTASNEVSFELDGYLHGMGVRGLFTQVYGTDLVHEAKGSSRYYERVLADAAVDPRTAIVIDDSPAALGWAATTGAKTVLISRTHPADGSTDLVIGSLAELPSVLERLL